MKIVVAPHPAGLRDLAQLTGLTGGQVADDGWLRISEALGRLRAAGFTESESTVRRMIDDGEIASYRTRRGHRRIDPRSLAVLINSRSSLRGEHVPEEATTPEHQPVVAAIVTSARGVLIGRRNDGKPPWTFIAGEIEPGESQADAAVREVKEETGLVVEAGRREIGRRVHPKTGRTMIYLACYPTGKTDVYVGDTEELAEVKWASLEEAEELLPGMFEPVLTHLRAQLST